jgi:hypothetical protein
MPTVPMSTEGAAPTQSGDAPDSARRSPALAAALLTLVAVMPVIATIAAHAGRRYFPVQDFALMDLRVRDVWSGEFPLVGAYSRFGWNHPGPSLYWALGLISRPFGQPAWATQMGAAVLQGVAIIAAARLAWIRGRLGLVLALLGVLEVGYLAAGSRLFLDPWNPYVAFPFFVLFVLEVWSVALGDTRQLVWMGLVGSFLVQAHVGYLPLVLAALVWTAWVLLRDVRAGARLERVRPRLIGMALVVGAMWTPAVIQQLLPGREGNVGLLASYFFEGQGSPIGLRAGAGLLAAEFRLPPAWIGGHERFAVLTTNLVPASPAWLLVAVVLVGVGVVAVRHTHARPDARLLVLTTLLVGVAIVTLARISGDVVPYLFLWRIPIALMLVLAVAGAVIRACDPSPLVRRVGAAGLVILISGASLGLSRAVVKDRPTDRTTRQTRALFDAVRHGRVDARPVIIRQGGSNPLGIEGGLFNALDRVGGWVRVDPERGFEFGRNRAARIRDVSEVWYVVEGGQFVSLLTELPGARVVAETSALSASDERRLRQDQRVAARELERAHRRDVVDSLQSSLFPLVAAGIRGVDQRLAFEIGRLNAKVERRHGCRCAVIAFPAREAPCPTFFSWSASDRPSASGGVARAARSCHDVWARQVRR